MIEFLAGAYVKNKYLELIPVHVVMQLAWFCHALDMELGGRDKGRAGATNAEWPLYRRCRPTREMVYGGSDGGA